MIGIQVLFELRFFRIKGQRLKHSEENFLDKTISLNVQGNIPRLSQHLTVPCPEYESHTYFAFLSVGGSRGSDEGNHQQEDSTGK